MSLRDLFARPKPGDTCKCGHDWGWHDHYTASTACANLLCGCMRFRRRRQPAETERGAT